MPARRTYKSAKAQRQRRRQSAPDAALTGWIEATVRPSDIPSRVTSGHQVSSELVARAVHWVAICAHINAVFASAVPVRLYRRYAGGGPRVLGVRRRSLSDPSLVGFRAAIYADQAGDVEEVTEHPVIDTLNRPNPWSTGTEHARLQFLYRELTGNSYDVIAEGDDGRTMLVPLAPQWTRIVPSDETFIESYTYGRTVAIEVFSPDEVVHLKHMPSPYDPYYGVGPMHAVTSQGDLVSASIEAKLSMWQNGARPDFWVELPENASPEAVKQARAEINKTFRGPQNAGKFFISVASKIHPLQWPPKDMQQVEEDKNVASMIWAAYGVPESMLRLNDANLASATAGNAQYQRCTILPRVQAYADALTRYLLPRFGAEPGELWFAPDNPVPEDRAAIAVQMSGLVNAGVLTPNEARAELGYPPIEGGDTVRDPSKQSDPLAALFGSQPVGAPPRRLHIHYGASDEARKEERRKHGPGRGRDTVAGAGEDQARVRISELVWARAESHPAMDVEGEPSLAGQTAKMISAFRRVFDRARPMIESSADINGMGSGYRAIEWERIIREEVGPVIREVFGSGWDKGGSDVGSKAAVDPFAVASEAALAHLARYEIKLASSVDRSVLARLNSAIGSVIEKGGTLTDVQRAVSGVMDDLDQYGSERIARTETSRAYNSGRLSAWAESGVVTHKEWLLSSEPCPLCETLARSFGRVALSDPFLPVGKSIKAGNVVYDNDWDDVHGPPAHPNCRCSVGAVFVGE